METASSFFEVKWLGREANHWFPSNAEVQVQLTFTWYMFALFVRYSHFTPHFLTFEKTVRVLLLDRSLGIAKVKLSLCSMKHPSTKMCGGWRYSSTHFLISCLDEGESSIHTTSTHWIGDCVGPDRCAPRIFHYGEGGGEVGWPWGYI